MSKIKLIDSWYDEENGNSYAKIRTDYGDFEGWSYLHEEDADIASRYAGCQYAETRAVLKYIKKRINILAYQIKALMNCQKQIESRASCSPDSAECRALRKQLFILQAEKKDWQSRYDSLSEKNYKAMSNRRKIIEHMKADQEKGSE